MRNIHLIDWVTDDLEGLRLDQAVAKLFPEYSRARLQNWIKNGQITVDNKKLRPKDRIFSGQKIEIQATVEKHSEELTAQEIPLSIVFEDNFFLIVNKPPGLVVHPGTGNPDKTMVNALLHYFPALNLLPRAGIIHRLDKDTSGLLIVAKTVESYTSLSNQMQKREISREYLALAQGELIAGQTISGPIGRHPHQRTKMAIHPQGKTAVTHVRIQERFKNYTLLLVSLETGRTHQIRVHLASIHHPIVGDPLYGGRLRLPPHASEDLKKMLREFKRQALHAFKISLTHPKTQERLTWTAALPSDIEALITRLRQENK